VFELVKTVSLNEMVYAELVTLSGELTAISKKPISLSMATNWAVSSLRRLLNSPGVREELEKRLKGIDFLTPKEFDKIGDMTYQVITKGKPESK
jgi:hypothetical protein